jgi:hypothetical protein
VQSSEAILWIGTPQLKKKIDAKSGNVVIEYGHICEKFEKDSKGLYRLWFSGNSTFDAFPSVLPPNIRNLTEWDFHDPCLYYQQLPKLAAILLGIASTPECDSEYSAYCSEVQKIRNTAITSEAIHKNTASLEVLVQQENENIGKDFKQHLADLKQKWRDAQQAVHEDQEQELNAHILQLKQDIVATMRNFKRTMLRFGVQLRLLAPPLLTTLNSNQE